MTVRGRYAAVLAPLLAAALFVGLVAWIVPRRTINDDEGFYALAAREAMAGRLPYRDFSYSQAPLLPYLNGVGLAVAGYDLMGQRALNAALYALALAVLWRAGRPRLGAAGAAVPVLAVLANPLIFAGMAVGKTYASTGVLTTLAAALLLSPAAPRRRMVALGLLGTLAVGCRLPAGVFFAPLWLHLLLLDRSVRGLVTAVLAPAVPALVLLGGFALAAGDNFWFWNLGYHLDYGGNWRIGDALADLPRYGGLALALGIAGLVPLARGRRWADPAAVLLAAGLLAIAVNLLPANCYASNLLPYFPVVGLAGALLWAERVRSANRPAAWVGAVAAAALVQLAVIRPPIFPQQRAALDAAAGFLRAHTPADGIVLSYDPLVPLQAGRVVPPRLVMGKFAHTAEVTLEEARRRNLFHHAELLAAVESGAFAALVLSAADPAHNFTVSFPSYGTLPKEATAEAYRAFLRRYEPAFKDEFFIVMLPRPEGRNE